MFSAGPSAEQCAWLERFRQRLSSDEGAVQLAQTHISWVLLTPTHAYKVKKDVALGFLDFSLLSLRRAACEAEWRLNARLAPELYLGVQARDGRGAVCAPAEAAEWVVQMHRFDEDQRLDRRLLAGTVSGAELDALADAVAQMHAAAPAQLAGLADQVQEQTRWQHLRARTVEGLRQGTLSPQGERLLLATEVWLAAQERVLAPLWAQRREAGWVRDGHGDLHLGNVCWFHGRPQLYDGLEFDETLRITDIAHDLAFLLMDLWAAGHHAVAWRLASRYLERLPDWSGVPSWSVFVALRALVRWRVAQLSTPADGLAGVAYQRVLAQGLAPRRPALILMHGWSGSGKSVVSQGLVEALGALRLRSDVVRQQLDHDSPEARYAPDQKARVYAQMRAWAAPALRVGWRVVLDATHLSVTERQAAQQLAEQAGVPWVIVSCQAPVEVLRSRVRARRGDASEADESVLDAQLKTSDALTEAELARTWVADTTRAPSCWTRRRTWRVLAGLIKPGRWAVA